MNEQLTVKNFGPIKDATVDFKRLTVFIGPTGGGKSTLAKLAAIFRDTKFYSSNQKEEFRYFNNYNVDSHFYDKTELLWKKKADSILVKKDRIGVSESLKNKIEGIPSTVTEELLQKFLEYAKKIPENDITDKDQALEAFNKFYSDKILAPVYRDTISPSTPVYIPSERAFIPSIEYSWSGLMRDDIGLPKQILYFANRFSNSRKLVSELEMPFFNVKYLHIDGHDYIKIPERKEPLRLYETASGIQSVTPMLVLLEHLSRQKEQVQSFIIEEPELNLYPTAQQGLMNWLVEKCTAGENDLTITTHSPYILSHLNLLLFAYQVAERHPDRADDVAKVVPRESWINPKEFACYHVEGQKDNGVHSIINHDTGLISYNGLDSTATEETSEFEKLLDINAGLEVE